MAKKRKSKSKRELEKEGRALGIELDRRHNKKTLISELEAIKPTSTDIEEDESVDITWNSIEEFSEAVTATGMIFDRNFIPVNVEALYEAYKSNPTKFKETSEYKFLIQ